MQSEGANSEHSARTGLQDGTPRQVQREMPRLSIRHSFSSETSSRRKKLFCLCLLCWLMVLCLTGIIIIAVVHFQSSDSEIDQISAGALIGFGLLLIVVLGWSAIIYAKFQKGSAIARHDSRQYAPREEILAFASSEIYARGASTISTNNSMSHSDSSSEGNPRRFIYRDRHRHDDERRVIDPLNTRYVTDPPVTAIHRSTRMVREYHERGPGVARPQVLHFPERLRSSTDAPRVFIDPNRASRHVRRHSHPLPPPYQPPVPSRPLSESLPVGFPPPAYDRVVGRMRRIDSTASEESMLYPPDYQSSPPSPSSVQTAAPTERRTSLNLATYGPTERRTSLSVPTEQQTIGDGIQISTLTRLDSSTGAHQTSPIPDSEIALRENVINQSPHRPSPVSNSASQALDSLLPRHHSHRYRSAAARHHPSLHSPNPPLQFAGSHSTRAPESPTRGKIQAPVYLTNNRSPFSRPILSLTAPENTIQETDVDNEDESGGACNTTETPSSCNQAEQQRPGVVLVYLSQSQEEEIIV